MSEAYEYNTIEEALEDLRAGKIILVTDDPDRENEGDMICAAEFATTENINFMACHAKGLICTPMSARWQGGWDFPRWFRKIRITIARLLRYLSIMWTRLREFRQQSGGLPCKNVQTLPQSLRSFADRGMCSHWWREKAECL